MDFFPIREIQATWDSDELYQKRKKHFPKNEASHRKGENRENKVLEFVLDRISQSHAYLRSSLFATASSPQIVLEGIPIRKKTRSGLSLSSESKLQPFSFLQKAPFPIGIQKCEYNSWLNALMQVIIFLPSLSEMFAYTPKSLSSFIEFIDQYRKDRLLGKEVTGASSLKLLETLRKKFHPSFLLKEEPTQHVCEILKLLMQTVHSGKEFSHGTDEVDLLALHDDWNIALQASVVEKFSWEECIEKHFAECGFFQEADQDLFFPFPSELLISFRDLFSKSLQRSRGLGDKWMPKRQFFLSYLKTPCALYELDAFIEYRPDNGEKGNYIAYLKVEGEWLQCDDTRIIPLRPSNLLIPLKRSFFLHYRRVRGNL